MIPQEVPEDDDETIAPSEVLFRLCKTGAQVSRREDGQYVLSTQIFAQNGSGCSIEFESLIEANGETPLTRVAAHNAFALVSITTQQVRTLEFRGPDGKPKYGLKVAYTPIGEGRPFGPNAYHGDIFPGPTTSANKALTKLRNVVIDIDQARAAIEYAKKNPGQQ